MIRIDIETICHDCPLFDAVSRTDILYTDNVSGPVTHTISCSRKDQCKELREYLGKKESRDDS